MILKLIERLTREADRQGLDFLIIGGHAVMHYGYVRMTLDLDLLARDDQREAWRQLMAQHGYVSYSESPAFIQFASRTVGWPAVDLMFVHADTWAQLRSEAVTKNSGNVEVLVPSVRHLVALKLHAAGSPTRSNPGKDWTDIEELIRRHRLDPYNAEFAQLILRHGGEAALARIRAMWDTLSKP
jgi:hypothetical protein